jgi:fatty-acid peroxygenase
MNNFPTAHPVAAIFGLVNDGFTFIMNRRRAYNTDIFKIPVPGMNIICFGGEDAAEAFYDQRKFLRKGAVPLPIQQTLTGVNAIHTTDDLQHHNRKALFMSLMTDHEMMRLQRIVRNQVEKASRSWVNSEKVILFDAISVVLCKAICEWAGVPLEPDSAEFRAQQFVSLVDAFGSIGARHIKGVKARSSLESWIAGIIQAFRSGVMETKVSSALHLCSNYRETNGKLLDLKLAAIELINILRPTVAISWYVSFGATALFGNEKYKEDYRHRGAPYQNSFINEIRRFFPFAPFMGAKVKDSFEWKNFQFPKGTLVLLDMYGTNHDERLWDDPFLFLPERFIGRSIKPYDFLAQGGGNPDEGHRCPGELITVETLKTVLDFLNSQLEFELPKQDLSYSLSRMPTRPVSGFIMKNVKLKI